LIDMKWKIIQASVVGTSHLANGTLCQDKCCTDIVYDRQGNEIFIGLVSDGAGSATEGLRGAEIACDTALKEITSWIGKKDDIIQCSSESEIAPNQIKKYALQFLKVVQREIEKYAHQLPEIIPKWIEKIRKKIEHKAEVKYLPARNSVFNLFPEMVQKWIAKIKEEIEHKARDKGLRSRDYACTLLGAVIATDFSAYFQVGDGAMVVYDGEYKIIFFPDTGEYANTTFFVTDKNVYDHLHIRFYQGRIDEIALFSDGLQRLVLHYKSKTAHGPFFEPRFSVLRKESPGYSDILSKKLEEFLSSKAVNERTDDDKTLVMATRKM